MCIRDSQYIDKIGVLIETNQAWAGPITFLLTLGESMVLLGLFIPCLLYTSRCV